MTMALYERYSAGPGVQSWFAFACSSEPTAWHVYREIIIPTLPTTDSPEPAPVSSWISFSTPALTSASTPSSMTPLGSMTDSMSTTIITERPKLDNLPPSEPSPPLSYSGSKAWIAGAVVGSVILATLLVLSAFWCGRRHGETDAQSDSSDQCHNHPDPPQLNPIAAQQPSFPPSYLNAVGNTPRLNEPGQPNPTMHEQPSFHQRYFFGMGTLPGLHEETFIPGLSDRLSSDDRRPVPVASKLPSPHRSHMDPSIPSLPTPAQSHQPAVDPPRYIYQVQKVFPMQTQTQHPLHGVEEPGVHQSREELLESVYA